MNQPSKETKLKMAEFFMKTSAPRILALMKHKGISVPWDLKCDIGCYKLIFEEGKDCKH